jgi:PKD domain
MHHRTWAALVATLSFGAIATAAPGTASAGWLPAQTVGVGEGGLYGGTVPLVAMNANGDAAVLTGPEDDPLALSTRAAGGGAFAPVSLPSAFADLNLGPALALGDDGTTVVGARDGSGLRASSGPLAGPMGSPESFSTDSWPGWTPKLAVAGDGTTIAAWNAAIGSQGVDSIRWAIKAPGGTWGPVQGSTLGSWPTLGSVSVSDDGHALITYNVYGDGAYAVSREPGGAFGAPERVSADDDDVTTAVSASAISGAVIDGGAAVIAFATAGQTVLVHRAPGSAAWGSRTTIDTGSTRTNLMAADDDGNFLMAYETADYHGVLVTGRIGGTHDAPYDIGLSSQPAIAVAGDGTATAVWSTFSRRLMTTHRSLAGDWSAPRAIDDPGDTTQLVGGDVPAATLAADDAGDLVVGWVAQSADYRVRRFDPTVPDVETAPPVFDAISIPAAGQAGRPVSLSARAHGASPVTVTWVFSDDTAATGTDVEHIFWRPDTYTVAVTATDADGNATTRTGTIAVTKDPPPQAPPAPPHHDPTDTWPPYGLGLPGRRPHCVVPALRHRTLAVAKVMLRRSHCALGRTTTPRRLGRRKGLVVGSQSRRPRTTAPNGAKIHVTLGVRPSRRSGGR